MSDEKRPVVRRDYFWPSIAAMVIAMMAFGYDCRGCNECHPPEPPPTQVAP